VHDTAEEPFLAGHHFAVLAPERMQCSVDADRRGIVRHVQRLRKQQPRVDEPASLKVKPPHKGNEASRPTRVRHSVAPHGIQRSELSTRGQQRLTKATSDEVAITLRNVKAVWRCAPTPMVLGGCRVALRWQHGLLRRAACASASDVAGSIA